MLPLTPLARGILTTVREPENFLDDVAITAFTLPTTSTTILSSEDTSCYYVDTTKQSIVGASSWVLLCFPVLGAIP